MPANRSGENIPQLGAALKSLHRSLPLLGIFLHDRARPGQGLSVCLRHGLFPLAELSYETGESNPVTLPIAREACEDGIGVSVAASDGVL